jgi:hypothetical protein
MLAVPLGVVSLVAGCQEKKYTYSLTLKNDAAEPLMVGFAKEGPPFEDQWATPEQVSRIPQRPGERGWGVPVAPGKTAEVPKVTARLDDFSTAYVRVYAAAPSLESMLAISTGSPNRLDVPLLPGANDLVVSRQGGKLVYQRLNR